MGLYPPPKLRLQEGKSKALSSAWEVAVTGVGSWWRQGGSGKGFARIQDPLELQTAASPVSHQCFIHNPRFINSLI